MSLQAGDKETTGMCLSPISGEGYSSPCMMPIVHDPGRPRPEERLFYPLSFAVGGGCVFAPGADKGGLEHAPDALVGRVAVAG